MTPIVEVKRLHYRYPDGTVALQDISFQLYPGETVALLGPNGSGKTTFVLHLNGLLRPSAGEVYICGEPLVEGAIARARSKVGVVFQDSDNQLFMPTVLEDVAFGPLNLGLEAEEAEQQARRALEQTGMLHAAAKAPYHISSGEKKRVAIAGVLAMQSSILILDEPTTFLDPPARRALLDLLRGLPQAKILVTHDLAFAAALATRAVFFQAGRVAGEGSVEEIIARFQWGLWHSPRAEDATA
jgi:cobalt/nickel transport system ATP-binding protein